MISKKSDDKILHDKLVPPVEKMLEARKHLFAAKTDGDKELLRKTNLPRSPVQSTRWWMSYNLSQNKFPKRVGGDDLRVVGANRQVYRTFSEIYFEKHSNRVNGACSSN